MDSIVNVNEQVIEVETACCVDEYLSRILDSETMSDSENMQGLDETREEAQKDTLRPPKRHRQEDEEEVWTTVNRRGKRLARAHETEESIRLPEYKIEVNITSTSAARLPKQFMLSKILKAENILDITRVKYINAYKVVIRFSNDDSADKLMDSKYFKENGYKCQRTFDIKDTYGVIKNIDLDSSEEEIRESLDCEIPILGVKRLKRRNSINGQWEPSEVIRICFKGTMLPTKVYIFGTVSSVGPYEYPVTQCARCWRYGHTVRVCPSNKAICPKCSGLHENCETTTFKCNNCHGKHMALARTCPLYKKEKRIRQLMAEFNCSYKRALTIYVPPEAIFQVSDSEDSCDARADDRDKYINEHNINTAARLSPVHADRTYADILKKTSKNKGKSDKRTQGKRQKDKYKSRGNEGENFTSENMGDFQHEAKDENTNSETNKINWRKILKQLKEKIFENKITIEEKIKACAQIVFDTVKQFVLNYLTHLPFFSFIKQWIADMHI